MDKILSIDFIGLPTKVMLSKSRRAKYIKHADKLSKRYLHSLYDRDVNEVTSKELNKIGKGDNDQAWWLNESYEFRDGKLYDKILNKFVLKNPKVAGTERWIDIDGQKFYSQGYNPFVRKKIVDELHKFWEERITNIGGLDPISAVYYPLFLEYTFNVVLADNADFDNYVLPYYKTLQDSLVRTGIIKNDTKRQIKGFVVLYEDPNSEDLSIASWGDKVLDTLTLTIYAAARKETSIHSTRENSESDQH